MIIKLLKKRGAKRLRSDNSYNPSTVYYILSNEMYVGDRRLQKEPHTDYRTKKPVPGGEYASYYIENDHEGIISREMWDAVQGRLKQEEERKANGIAEGFSKLVGTSISPFLLFCILVLLVQVTSQFISNSTAIIIVLPILLSIAPTMGLNAYAYALGITLASGVALSCPLASSTLGMSMVVGYKFNDYIKCNIWLDVLGYITIIAMVPAIYGLTI